MLAAALGGLDAFVFTAGIGENSADIRARIAAKLAWLGAVLDPKANAAHALSVTQRRACRNESYRVLCKAMVPAKSMHAIKKPMAM